MSYEVGMYCLLFSYGFTLAYHLMGMTKYYNLGEFDWKKAGLGLLNEVGYIAFWLLIFFIPQFIDLKLIGIDFDPTVMMNVLMVYPLAESIKKAYTKAMELKQIKINE